MISFTKKQIVEHTGLTTVQVQFYTEHGVVVPEVDRGVGRGHIRRYSGKNLIQFLVVRELIGYGITLSKVKEIILSLNGLEDRWWKADEDQPTRENFVFLVYKPGGGKGYTAGWRSSNKISLELTRYNGAIVINVGALIAESAL